MRRTAFLHLARRVASRSVHQQDVAFGLRAVLCAVTEGLPRPAMHGPQCARPSSVHAGPSTVTLTVLPRGRRLLQALQLERHLFAQPYRRRHRPDRRSQHAPPAPLPSRLPKDRSSRSHEGTHCRVVAWHPGLGHHLFGLWTDPRPLDGVTTSPAPPQHEHGVGHGEVTRGSPRNASTLSGRSFCAPSLFLVGRR